MKSSRLEWLDLRGRRQAVRRWGHPEAPPLVLLHGWMDVSASFQFVVDALAREWAVLAPDWRGFGESQPNRGPYWFPDYLGDLDALLNHCFPDRAVPLVGHSMGGNVACLYAGLRPERVSHLVSLEGFGINDMAPAQAPERLSAWLDQLASPPQLHGYADAAALASRLQRDNPRLTPVRAAFLAQHLGRPRADGRLEWAGDPWHKAVSPTLYRLEEAKACWRRVTAPTLWVRGAATSFLKRFHIDEGDYRSRLACFARIEEAVIADAGHMLHHDGPAEVAALLESFISV
ncbi:MAG TPA: alpha/beta hydrolase [Azospira sp.]|nr:alpha/beta hydrolase [Azospira sp.]